MSGKLITATDIFNYQIELRTKKTLGEFIQLGIEIRDKHGLTDREAIDILNNEHDSIMKILIRSDMQKAVEGL